MPTRKRFGQHFLHDRGVIDKIISMIDPQAGQQIVEIGPGRGAISRALAQSGADLTLIELDRDLIEPLKNDPQLKGCRIIQGDALKVDFQALTRAEGALRVVGNFPYNISTPLIFKLLQASPNVQDIHCMLQHEVVRRLAASHSSKDYGRLSVMVQYRCAVTPLFRVAPGAFHPVPRVDSAVVRLQPRPPSPTARDETRFAAIVTAAFSQRRKMLANALKGLVSATTLSALDIDPGWRAERISVAQFVTIANHHDNQQ